MTAGAEPQVFRLQLRNLSGKASGPSLQTVAGEFATRYLEQLGVSPARQTLELVQKCIPLTDSNVTTTLRAKGHVNDELQLSVPAVAHTFKVPKVIHQHDVLQLGMANNEVRSLTNDASSGSDVIRNASASRSLVPSDKQLPGSQFKHMAARFLHPFNLDTNLAELQLDELLCFGKTGSSSSPASKPAQRERESDLSNSDKDYLRAEICDELLQDLSCTPEVVLTLTAHVEAAIVDWHHHQAPETLKGRLSDQEFKAALELLTDQPQVLFFITLLNFLHEEYVRSSPSYPLQLEEQALDSWSQGGGLLPSTRIQNMDKYDLGYRLWIRERNSQQPQVTSGQQQQQQLSSSATGGRAGLFYHQSTAAVTVQTARSMASSVCETTRSPHFGRRASKTPDTTCKVSKHHANPRLQEPSRFVSFATTLHSNTAQPQTCASRATAQSRCGSVNSSVRPGALSIPSEIRYSPPSSGRASPCYITASQLSSPARGQTPSAMSLFDAASRSMAHIPTVQALHAAVADAAALPSHLTQEDNAQLQQARLFVLQKEFASLHAGLRLSRAGMFFTLPLFLVTARLMVNMLYNNCYKLWSKTPEGREAIQLMDQAVEHMFDPNGHIQHSLSILQSSQQAVDACARHPHKSHMPERQHFADVSPLVRSFMTDPASPAARKLLHQSVQGHKAHKASGTRRKEKASARQDLNAQSVVTPAVALKGPLKTELTQAQREALFAEKQALLAAPPPPVLMRLGEPAAAQELARDSWIAKSY